MEATDRSDWSLEMYVSAGQEATQLKFYSQWMIAKLANEVSGKWGDVSKWAREISIPATSVLAYLQVYRRILDDAKKKGKENYVPDGYVPWGVLQIATRASVESPIDMIEELSKKGATSIKEAYREVKSKETGKQVAPKPRAKFTYNEEKDQWTLFIDPDTYNNIDWDKVRKPILDYLTS